MNGFCPNCGTPRLVEARFCQNCGQRLPEAEAQAVQSQAAGAAGERRLLTFVFADLVGSTQLAERLDPEELLDITRDYQRAVSEAIAGLEGFVARYTGDGVLAYFGYPVAHEEDTIAAVRAGLAIVESVERLGKQVGVPLRMRVGIASGLVVAAETAGTGRLDENAFIGSAPNLAARLQGLAEPGQVVVAQATRRIAGEAFRYRDLGEHVLKGFDQPVRAYAVEGERLAETRLELRLTQRRSAMVGRAEELERLLALWADAGGSGRLRAALVVGDAGIGKSRLVRTLDEAVANGPHTRVTMQCLAQHQNSVLHPLIQQLPVLAGFEPQDGAPERLAKLTALCGDLPDAGTALPLLAALLSVPGPALPPMSPLLQKQRTFGVVLDLLRQAAGRAPMLLVFEDLHWADPTSLELLDVVLEQLADAPLLALLTSRPGPRFAFTERPEVVSVTLARLSAEESAALAAALLPDAAGLYASTLDSIVRRGDGVPLFIEELTQILLDTGHEDIGGAARALPETLLGLLTERLDRLGSAKPLAQTAAVIGRECTTALLAAVDGRDRAALEPDIAALLASGLLQRRDDAAEETLIFKHALVQDAAEASVLHRHRRELHGRIADAIMRQFPDFGATHADTLARHLHGARRWAEASRQWVAAGRQAIGRGAPREAVAHFEAGLAAAAAMPEGPERTRCELDVMSGLGPAQMIMKGPGHPDFGTAQRRAIELCRALPERPGLVPVTYGLALHHWGRAEFAEAEALAAELRATAAGDPTEEHVMAANNMSAMIRLHRGAPREVRALLGHSTGLYRADSHAPLYPRYMMDFGVFGRFYLALSLAVTGAAEQARQVAAEAAALAESLGQPHSRGFSQLANFIVAAFLEDPAEARRWATLGHAFSGQQGFPEFVALADIVHGWADAAEGRPEEGLARLEGGIALWQATGFETWQTWYGALRAEILVALGRPEEALTQIDAQFERAAANGERIFESLLLAGRAEALRALGAAPSEVEALRDAALTVAERQGAAAWARRIGRLVRHGPVP